LYTFRKNQHPVGPGRRQPWDVGITQAEDMLEIAADLFPGDDLLGLEFAYRAGGRVATDPALPGDLGKRRAGQIAAVGQVGKETDDDLGGTCDIRPTPDRPGKDGSDTSRNVR
jgi:hypothetical protein